MSSPVTTSHYDVFGVNDLPPRPARTDGDAATAKAGNPLFGEDGFTFSDFLDIINPLQHIPIVNTVYRAVTGDKINPGSRLAGGTLFGGPIGLVASLVSGMVEESTGKDPGEHALAALGIELGPTVDAPQTMLASASNATASAQPLPQPDMKLAVAMDPRAADGKSAPAKQVAQPAANGAIELPADLFQALKQTAATQQADARSDAINNVRANPLPGQQMQPHTASPMQVNAAVARPSQAGPVQGSDGRTWYPAHPPGGGGTPTRSVGTSPVTQANATAKFGTVRGNNYMATPQSATASTAAMVQGDRQSEWSNRASDAYQKYFEMQNEKNRRAGVVP
jgi:hypothetical protein